MRLHALVLALFVFAARAATIPEKSELDFEKKLSDAVKEVIRKDENAPEKISSEQDLIDETNFVKEAENNLRKQIVDIPVKVVVDDKATVKSDTDKKEDNEVVPESVDNIKREEIDVKDPPGPIQRQVHDTQNPEHFEDAKVKQATDNQNQPQNENQNLGPLASAQQNFNNWVSNNQQIQNMQQSIKEFQENFNKQVGTIANIVRGVLQGNYNALQPQGVPGSSAGAPATAPILTSEVVQKDDKSSDVRSVPAPKQESSSGSSGNSTSEGNNWWNQVQVTLGVMQNQLNNLTQQFQTFNSQQQQQQTDQTGTAGGFFQNLGSGLQFFNIQNQNNASQSDEAQKPGGIWQNIQNFFQPPQDAQSDTQQPNRPIIQAVQNAIGSFWRPGQSQGGQTEPQKPASPEKPNEEGSNAVPEKPAEQQKEPEPVTLAQSGPIKQLIANNPIAQGLAGAVQKIQHTIKPDQPRDTIQKTSETENHGVKGGFFIKPGHGHKPGHGDNTDKGSSGLDNGSVTELDDASAGVGRPSGATSNWVAAKTAPQENEPEKKKEEIVQEEKVPEGPQKTE